MWTFWAAKLEKKTMLLVFATPVLRTQVNKINDVLTGLVNEILNK